jgi:hypothetical protein
VIFIIAQINKAKEVYKQTGLFITKELLLSKTKGLIIA